jgi:hypothetical protein
MNTNAQRQCGATTCIIKITQNLRFGGDRNEQMKQLFGLVGPVMRSHVILNLLLEFPEYYAGVPFLVSERIGKETLQVRRCKINSELYSFCSSISRMDRCNLRFVILGNS